jgi:hypothetical protein
MSIKTDVDDLQKIKLEIKRTNDALKKLRETQRTIEERITTFLKDKDLPGVKCNQNIVILQQTKTSKVKPKKVRRGEILNLLESCGVNDPEAVFKRINEIGKEKITKDVVRIDKRV